jgi:hypothetical protein
MTGGSTAALLWPLGEKKALNIWAAGSKAETMTACVMDAWLSCS